MSTDIRLLPGAIAELFAQISYSHVVTLADRYGLLAALLDESLTEEDRSAIDRLLRSISRKQVELSNELSTVL